MKTRIDIQALRGLAILLVVLYHTKADFFASGFLGVDIFFVVSGYLITGLITNEVKAGNFSFSGFYFRRAKRLLPAAYVTFLVTALLAPQFLGSMELSDFVAQMIGAVTFTGNFVLWWQSGYFQGAAELKPLLHVWSLAIEEQYYLLLPAALVFMPRRYWLPGTVIVLVASVGLCIVGSDAKPVATFYLLPTRGWELAVGSLGALTGSGSRLHRMAPMLFPPALVALVVVPCLPIHGPHPGWGAMVVCVATLIVILRNHPVLNGNAPMRLLAGIGDFSYSLYLVHWPVFAFAKNAWAGDPPDVLPAAIRMGALLLSLLLGWLLYRFVEAPVRRAELVPTRPLVMTTLAASVALVVISIGMARVSMGSVDFAQLRRVNLGFGEACEFKAAFEAKPQCRNVESPAILVWGDSIAMHLVPGIAATSGTAGVIQATRSVCGPLLGIAPMGSGAGTGYDKTWAASCIAFNQSVVAWLATAPSVQVVVLSSRFGQYLDASRYHVLQQSGREFTVADAGADVAIAGIRNTTQAVRALGKRVVVVAPPPSSGFDIGGCLERKAEGKVLIDAPRDCEVPLADYRKARKPVLDFLERVPRDADVAVVGFDDLLCGERACATSIDGTLVYRDAEHLSYAGSVLVAERGSLGGKLQALAR